MKEDKDVLKYAEMDTIWAIPNVTMATQSMEMVAHSYVK